MEAVSARVAIEQTAFDGQRRQARLKIARQELPGKLK